METEKEAVDVISKILTESTKTVLSSATGKEVTCSSTLQVIPKVSMKPDLACFVQFTGHYNGLIVTNFTEDSAVFLYRNYMMSMGIPEKELARDFTSIEVSDSIGELTNQIMGHTISQIEEEVGLNSIVGQPRALSINSAITLVIDPDYRSNRRLSFKIDRHPFQIEIAMEQSTFMNMDL